MGDLHIEVRKLAVQKLGEQGAAEELAAVGLADGSTAVRSVVVEWLSRLGQPVLLGAALSDTDPNLRMRALVLLENESQDSAIALAAAEDEDPRVRSHALEALSRLKNADAIAAGLHA